ncbi:hypothetical protein VTO42DRAFT_821 [Malbranchea cinnamomea]
MPPRRQWIDKNTATKYQLFHRSQDDPLINDPDADDRVLHRVSGPAIPPSSATSKGKSLKELEKEFGSQVRKNEGEAANYGIFFDDSKYDYMQHLRELGGGGGDSHFIEAKPTKGKGKPMSLEDALREKLPGNLEDRSVAGSVYGDDALSTVSSYVRPRTYQDQQDIPDDIAGFKPDMDPRLREALEALEDDAYVDEDAEDDFFESLVEGGPDAEMDPSEWRDTYIDDKDDGWQSDATEKAPVQYSTTSDKASELQQGLPETQKNGPTELPAPDEQIPDATEADGDWLKNFAKYKKGMKAQKAPNDTGDNASDLRTTPSTMFTVGGTPVRRKKRKGALTNPSSYSMTSSSLARTEGQRLLDARFEKIEALYTLDEEGDEYDGSMPDDMSLASGVSKFSKFSQAPSLVSQGDNETLPSNFDEVMDSFLGNWQDRGGTGKRKGAKGKRGKNGNEAMGIRMLDEIRQELGPARIKGRG